MPQTIAAVREWFPAPAHVIPIGEGLRHDRLGHAVSPCGDGSGVLVLQPGAFPP